MERRGSRPPDAAGALQTRDGWPTLVAPPAGSDRAPSGAGPEPRARAPTPGGIALRASGDGTFMTDGGHYILDASFGRIPDADALASSLNDIPGVVEHGLFINMASLAIIAGPAGARTLTAKD